MMIKMMMMIELEIAFFVFKSVNIVLCKYDFIFKIRLQLE